MVAMSQRQLRALDTWEEGRRRTARELVKLMDNSTGGLHPVTR